ncbi:hypothetical protein RUND412_005458 [Rhizina undulata]
MGILSNVVLVLTAIQLALAAPLRSNVSYSWEKNTQFLVFGDSYTFVQGTAGRDNYSFIGDAFDYSFTEKELLSNRIVKNWTSSGGSNWVEFLTGCYEGFPRECKNQLWDFAFAGADISSQYLTLHHNYSVDLVDQVKQWDLYAKRSLKFNPKRAIAAFFIGINDINDSAKWTNVSFPEFYDTLVGEYFNTVETVYKGGYENFLFMNLPPLDRTPGNQISANPKPNITQIQQFNDAISRHATKFARRNKDANILVFDTYTTLSGFLDNPQDYGISNTTR